MKKVSQSVEIGGRTLTLETGGIAPQAKSAVLARYGDTEVLAAVCTGMKKEDLGFLPLGIEYVERLYAGGRIKGSRWVKREGRPSDEAILVGRLVDRSLRPLFPKDYFDEIQITITVLSVDLENSPDTLSVIAASAALAISDIPWNGPVGAVRVGLKDGNSFVNPVNGELEFSDLDLVVSSTKEKVVMIEASAKEVSEEKFLEAVNFGQKETEKIISLISLLAKEVGAKKKEIEKKEIEEKIKTQVEKAVEKNLALVFSDKAETFEVKGAILAEFPDESKSQAGKAFDEAFKKIVREKTLEGKRIDGRKPEEIRPIEIQVGLLPRTHGSALFSRGQTQVLTVTTLGSPSLEQLIESAEGEETKRFIHHYSMPPYSMGEVGRMTGPSRREVGHGALAEKAIEPVIPLADKFPYTIRLVSEVLSSNGSTSMASVCGSTLSLMDAGVPILAPVAGIAMGLMSDGKKSLILTDICGSEDFNGDMDFKVAGTKKGITAVQLDIKISGLEEKLIAEALKKACEARLFILEKMKNVLPEPREKLSQYAPRVTVLHIEPEKIGEVIGPGGKVIRRIMAETGASVDIEDNGAVSISGLDDASVQRAVSLVEGLTREIHPEEVFEEGVVKRIQPFGAFVEILPGKEGLVHVSQMSTDFVKDPAEILSVGQKVKVRVVEIDELKRINLSMLFGEQKEKPPLRPRVPKGNTPFFRPRRRPSW